MKSYIPLLVILFAFISSGVQSQTYERKTVQAGQSLTDYAYFLFPSFSDAMVRFKNGGKLEAKMNFNMFICQMQFLDPHGDTLSLSKPEEIDSIYLNNCIFFYKSTQGYYEIYPGTDSLKLMALRKVSYEAVKIGALGIPSHTGTGITSYTELVDKSTGSKELIMNEDVDVTRETTYYIMNKSGEMIIAGKSNFLKMFEQDKKSVEAFIKTNKINFNKDTDLQRLLRFCINPSASATETH